MHPTVLTLAVALAVAPLSACADDSTPSAALAASAMEAAPAAGHGAVVADPADAAFAWPTMTVHKSPYCGCCVV